MPLGHGLGSFYFHIFLGYMNITTFTLRLLGISFLNQVRFPRHTYLYEQTSPHWIPLEKVCLIQKNNRISAIKDNKNYLLLLYNLASERHVTPKSIIFRFQIYQNKHHCLECVFLFSYFLCVYPCAFREVNNCITHLKINPHASCTTIHVSVISFLNPPWECSFPVYKGPSINICIPLHNFSNR